MISKIMGIVFFVGFLVWSCFSNGLKAENYSLQNNFRIPYFLLAMDSDDGESEEGSDSPRLSDRKCRFLNNSISSGRTLAIVGTIGWSCGFFGPCRRDYCALSYKFK